MSEPIFMFDGQDPQMHRASEDARRSFKFFWRELSWERRRIVPGLDMAMIKLPFTDGPRSDGEPTYEHMWVDDVAFDGILLKGRLVNSPNWLTSVKEGDLVAVPFSHLGDWMITAEAKVYGAHTVNLMRSRMSTTERRSHDAAWGLDFGDPSQILLEIGPRTAAKKPGFLAGLLGRSTKPPPPIAGFHDHPMCENMIPKYEAQIKADPSISRSLDDQGWTLLQREALAGNLGMIKLLLRDGADPRATTPTGQDAASLARTIGWTEVADLLDQAARP